MNKYTLKKSIQLNSGKDALKHAVGLRENPPFYVRRNGTSASIKKNRVTNIIG